MIEKSDSKGLSLATASILGLLREWPLELTLGLSQAFASLLVALRGATVDDPEFYRQVLREWRLD